MAKKKLKKNKEKMGLQENMMQKKNIIGKSDEAKLGHYKKI